MANDLKALDESLAVTVGEQVYEGVWIFALADQSHRSGMTGFPTHIEINRPGQAEQDRWESNSGDTWDHRGSPYPMDNALSRRPFLSDGCRVCATPHLRTNIMNGLGRTAWHLEVSYLC